MKRAVLLLVAVTTSFLLAACQGLRVESAGEGTMVGEKAQDFTLKDLKENSISLSSFFGKKILLLSFSTTWCPDCIAIIPALKDIHTGYKDVEVAAVFIKESKATMEKFAKRYQIPYTILLDRDASVASKYSVRGVPTVIIVDKNCIIRYRGSRISPQLIEGIIKK